jgi:osmotically-inducible protein OsmY
MAGERRQREDQHFRRGIGSDDERRPAQRTGYSDYGFGREDGPASRGYEEMPPDSDDGRTHGRAFEAYGYGERRGRHDDEGRSGSGYGLSGRLGPGYTGRGAQDDRISDYGSRGQGGPGTQGYGGGQVGGYGYYGEAQGRGRGYGQDIGTESGRATQTGVGYGREYGTFAYGRDYGPANEGRSGQGEHRGRGPRGYKRSDERIREDVNDRLTDDPLLDASGIEVGVSDGEVTLSGTVQRREDKRRAEDVAERVSGVAHVQNNLRVGSGERSFDVPS